METDFLSPFQHEVPGIISESRAEVLLGQTIGPYRVLNHLGEGGFGDVYVAEQSQPLQRRVALKILKPGMDSRQVLARFNMERQALALMEHPNIAHVIDADETANGRPYFVLELVDGLPITDYCNRHQLGIADRLRLVQDPSLR